MSDLNDKVALITGASSGIGRTTAEAFAARGAKLVLTARRTHELEALTSEIESRGGSASFEVTDVQIAKDVERMERTETVNLNAPFERVTTEEAEIYAQEGTLRYR